MYHENIRISLSTWFDQDPKRQPIQALVMMVQTLTRCGYRSLELDLAEVLRYFTDFAPDQSTLSEPRSAEGAAESPRYRRLSRGAPSAYATCLRTEDRLIFLDVEIGRDRSSRSFDLEADLFTPSRDAAVGLANDLLRTAVDCFHLPSDDEDQILRLRTTEKAPPWLSEMAASRPLVARSLHKRLAPRESREILRGVKKRGSILETDLAELAIPGITPAEIASVLEEFSSGDERLLEKKRAIVCARSREIIFLLRQADDLEGAGNLECPKCSSRIADELVLSYFERTEQLRELFDGNRWMPLLVRDALVDAGVPTDSIHTELKYDQDEIDVLALYRNRVFVIEAKDRPFSLNDAYKLAAKTTRLESAALRHPGPPTAPTDFAAILAGLEGPQKRPSYIPVVVSSSEVAQDARDLLTETKDTVWFLEHADDGLDAFAHDIVSSIDAEDMAARLQGLIGDASDSIGRLASRQIFQAFHSWLETTEGSQRVPVPHVTTAVLRKPQRARPGAVDPSSPRRHPESPAREKSKPDMD